MIDKFTLFSALPRLLLGLVVALALGLFLGHIKNQYARTRQQVILNTTRPSFEALVKQALGATDTSLDAKTRQHYQEYFETAVAFAPDNDQAHAVLAYVYMLGDNHKKAHQHFQKAYALNPQSLIHQYNVGLMFFQQQKYDDAAAVLKNKAHSPQEELNALQSSIIYRQLLPNPTLWQQLPARLIQLQQHRQALMIESAQRAASNDNNHTPIPLTPRIF